MFEYQQRVAFIKPPAVFKEFNMLRKISFLIVSLVCSYAIHAQQEMDSVRRNFFFSVMKEKDLAKKEVLYNQFAAQYWITESNESAREQRSLNAAMAAAYQELDSVKEYEKYASKIGAEEFAFSYLNFAKKLVSQNKYPAYAKKFATEALKGFEKTRLNKPVPGRDGKNPPVNDSAFKVRMNNVYADHLDVLAYACYLNKDYAEGYPYSQKAAVDLQNSSNWQYNEHYALLLAKTQPAAKAQKELERLMRTGMLNENGQAALKEVYAKNKKSIKGYDAYLAKLQSEVIGKAEDTLRRIMINKKAADFNLVNLDGETVSLKSLKGKTVVLDFWATWCVPCVASFPAMQKTIDRFKNDKNVVFLFISTKEVGSDKTTKVKNFMAKDDFKNFNFNVLLDNDNSVGKSYDLEGMPSKYVIDPKGNIRFVKVGYTGKEDELLEELTLMIKMVQQ